MTVLEGKFKRRDELVVKISSQLLYIDEYVCLMRVVCTLGNLSSVQHVTVDLKTGSSVH